MTYDIKTIYTRYKQLSKKERSELLTSLQRKGIDIVRIEAYEYKDAPAFKHLYFYFRNSKTATPYFMLDKDTWQLIQEQIMEVPNNDTYKI